MTPPAGLVLNVAELLRRPATRRHVHLELSLDGLEVDASRVDADARIVLDADIESLSNGLIVTGSVETPWTGLCRRCLEPAGGQLRAEFQEVFEPHPAADGEAFPIVGDRIDLEPLVREVLMCDLPLAPLCRPDCAGLCPECGANRNDRDCGHRPSTGDPRWAALDVLRDQG